MLFVSPSVQLIGWLWSPLAAFAVTFAPRLAAFRIRLAAISALRLPTVLCFVTRNAAIRKDRTSVDRALGLGLTSGLA
eukprot:5708269-Pyramimonas_sp.AAC.1